MNIEPAAGVAFIIEDTEDFSAVEKIGLKMPEDALKGVGSTGKVYAITHDQEGLFPRLRNWLFADRITSRYKKGQRVIFDKFVASDIYLRDSDGNEIDRLKSVPADCIIGLFVEKSSEMESAGLFRRIFNKMYPEVK